MAWATITIYTSKCAQMDPQQLPKTSKLYSKCKKCDIEKTLGECVHPLLVARRLTGARPACQRHARLAMGRRLDKLSPGESCDLAGPALKSAVVFVFLSCLFVCAGCCGLC